MFFVYIFPVHVTYWVTRLQFIIATFDCLIRMTTVPS